MLEIEFILIFIALIIMILLGVELFTAFGITSILLYMQSPNATTLIAVGQTSIDGLNSFTLLAVPLFIITGDLLASTGVAKKLFKFVNSVFDPIPGGIGLGTQAACGLFAAISGSNTADAAAIGRVSINELRAYGYTNTYAGGLIASASITGILIPPSIAYIVLGLSMNISVSRLFIGSIIPGILMIGMMMITHLLRTWRTGHHTDTSSWKLDSVVRNFWDAKYGVALPIIIIGGIYSGIFTPTESAIAAIAFMIVVGVGKRTLHTDDYWSILTRSAALNGMVSPLIVIFTLFSQSIGFFKIPSNLVQILVSMAGGNKILIVIVIGFVLLIAGTVISTIPNILLLGPLLIPVGVRLGFNVYHFSVFFLSVLALGFITPPVGLNLFVTAGIIDEPVEGIAKEAFPFFIAGLLSSIIILLIPQTVLILSTL